MKFRTSHITNSSSSSFIVDKRKLTPLQIILIEDHIRIGAKMGLDCAEENQAWTVVENSFDIDVYTHMDNFPMLRYLDRIGVPVDAIERGEF